MKLNNHSLEGIQKFESFNGLKAIAALGIAMMHYNAFIVVKPSKNFLTSNCIPFFTEFVFLFFIISAFGMCRGYYKKFAVDMRNKTCSFDTDAFVESHSIDIRACGHNHPIGLVPNYTW